MAREDWSNPDAWPTNADTLWPLIIAHLAKDGVGPEQVIVYVYRMNVGQFVADKDKVKIGTIKGDSIKPYGGMSASEAQFYYLSTPSTACRPRTVAASPTTSSSTATSMDAPSRPATWTSTPTGRSEPSPTARRRLAAR